MDTEHTKRCQQLVSWRRTHGGQLPSRNSVESEELALANWISRTLNRRSKRRSSGPFTRSQQQLTDVEVHDFEEALGNIPASRSQRKRLNDESDSRAAVPKSISEQHAALPDTLRCWNRRIPIRGPGGHVFMKAVRAEFGQATADGEKYFECSRAKNMFKSLDAGDLLLLVQTRTQLQVVAVCEVAHQAVSRESNRAVLYDRLPSWLRDSLNTYLDAASAFDYVLFEKVFDLRDSNLKVKDVLAYGGFCMHPRKNFGMGVLEAVETSDTSFERLRSFLETQTVRWAASRFVAVDDC